MLAYCYYPLCWVLFISTSLLLRMSLWNGTMLLPTMLGSFHFYVTLEQLHEKVCKCYYPLCWVLFISTKTKPYLNMEFKRYYPLCWVLFISTNLTATIDTTTMLLPTMLGSFHFYRCWKTRSVSSIVITHYVGFFSFLRYPFRSPVKSRLSKGIFVSIYLNILKKEFFNHFFVLVKILG